MKSSLRATQLQNDCKKNLTFLTGLKDPSLEESFDPTSCRFCENSLIRKTKKADPEFTIYVPAYVRYIFRNMTEMDIENLSAKFVAAINITIYLCSYATESEDSKNKKEEEQYQEEYQDDSYYHDDDQWLE